MDPSGIYFGSLIGTAPEICNGQEGDPSLSPSTSIVVASHQQQPAADSAAVVAENEARIELELLAGRSPKCCSPSETKETKNTLTGQHRLVQQRDAVAGGERRPGRHDQLPKQYDMVGAEKLAQEAAVKPVFRLPRTHRNSEPQDYSDEDSFVSYDACITSGMLHASRLARLGAQLVPRHVLADSLTAAATARRRVVESSSPSPPTTFASIDPRPKPPLPNCGGGGGKVDRRGVWLQGCGGSGGGYWPYFQPPRFIPRVVILTTDNAGSCCSSCSVSM